MPVSLVPGNPFRDIDHLGREFNHWLNLSPFQAFGGMNTAPRVDLFQTDDEVVVKAEIPGVAKEDLNVYLDDNLIRLSGQIKRGNEFKDENIYRTERYYGSFSRTVPLPVEVRSDEARAEYQDGILSIKMPKATPSKIKGKRIEIN